MNVKAFVKKYTMVIALVAVFILFGLLTHGELIRSGSGLRYAVLHSDRR